MKKINWKSLMINIFIPVALGFLVGLLSNSKADYNNLVLPPFAPPSWVFPVVWTLLYILMGISSYLILENTSYDYQKLIIYIIQLIVNLLWSIIFFVFNLRLLAFIWILILDALVIVMIIRFCKTNKTAALIQIPYLLWILFASVLNLSIFILN